ncbi:S-layer homology domain-containing protein [Candidatus Gracilibacteria bacterium]|nr:S-layer homology domain-containing protein [Candidatus Gracilibacteria bacterium]
MKNILSTLILVTILGAMLPVHASDETDAAGFLAYQGIIAARDNSTEYRVGNTITRREMLKITMNIAGKNIPETCGTTHKFNDLDKNDWGCKYADAALKAGYIAKNANYRPDDNVSKVEALKLIMQAKGIEREQNSDWKLGYVNTARNSGIIEEKFTNYDTAALRGWIFIVTQDAITSSDEDMLELIDFLFGN